MRRPQVVIERISVNVSSFYFANQRLDFIRHIIGRIQESTGLD